MGLAIPNQSLKSALIKDGPADVNARAEDLILSIFTGDLPAQVDAEAQLTYHAHGWQELGSVYTWATTTLGNTELLQMEWNDFSTREHLTATKVRFNISKRTEIFEALATGQAGWFMLCEQDEAAAYTTWSRWAVLGTVGLEGSGADLILPSVDITLGDSYRGNDITIDFEVQGTIA